MNHTNNARVGDKTNIMDLIIEEVPVFRLMGVSVAKGIIQHFRQTKIKSIYMNTIYMFQAWKKNYNT